VTLKEIRDRLARCEEDLRCERDRAARLERALDAAEGTLADWRELAEDRGRKLAQQPPQ
jgi:hypothetical protein